MVVAQTVTQLLSFGGVWQLSNTKSHCVAPCVVRGFNASSLLAVGFWAAADNCCSGERGGVSFGCSLWTGSTLGEVVNNQVYVDASNKAVEW